MRTHDLSLKSVNTLSACSADVSYDTWLLDRFWGFKVISFCLFSKCFAIVMFPESFLEEVTNKGSSPPTKVDFIIFFNYSRKTLYRTLLQKPSIQKDSKPSWWSIATLACSSLSKTGLCNLAAGNRTLITDFPFKLALSSSLAVTAIEDLSAYLRGRARKNSCLCPRT